MQPTLCRDAVPVSWSPHVQTNKMHADQHCQRQLCRAQLLTTAITSAHHNHTASNCGTWGVRRWRRYQGAFIGHADVVQSTSAHELLTVHRVDGPARVTRLPPRGHCLRLQLPDLHLTNNLVCQQTRTIALAISIICCFAQCSHTQAAFHVCICITLIIFAVLPARVAGTTTLHACAFSI